MVVVVMMMTPDSSMFVHLISCTMCSTDVADYWTRHVTLKLMGNVT